ncbi:MAG: Tex-like N-terminal domain-containing protein [Bacteroidia bacterium]
MSQKLTFIELQTGIPIKIIKSVLQLKEEGGSIAFIARYRKDQTNNLDELGIIKIIEKSEFFDELAKRKLFILETIKEQGKLNSDLQNKIELCFDKDILEDLYLPFKQKKKTRASQAFEKGLEPLAKIILAQRDQNIEEIARRFVKNKVSTIKEAITGASDIVAQWISDDADTRNMLRGRFEQHAIIETKLSKGKADEAEKYNDYFKYSEKANSAATHRIMAIFRAEKEGLLTLSVLPDENKTLEALDRKWIRRNSMCPAILEDIISDSYKRLLRPSLENEFKQKLFEKAETDAIQVFANNLNQLLLSAPLGNKRILAIDPGIRSGCKTVCLDEAGNLIYHSILFFNSNSEKQKSISELSALLKTQKIEAIAIGNGTAGRETYDLIRREFKDTPSFLINEDGASIYSVSELARKEFPNYDVTVKGAVSIGRRLIDPLAELVKIDAKSIGVGQYQHDVNQTKLKKALIDTVEICVNKVGVNINTAGEELLKHVSGLGEVLAKNIVEYRNKNGEFKDRNALKKVPRLGEKAFEQCAGFLRIRDGENKLDNSAVHPEQYKTVEKMAKLTRISIPDMIGKKSVIDSIRKLDHIREEIGHYTFDDILLELEKPGLDPRESIQSEQFDSAIQSIHDLKVGMLINGIIINITNFGAFVDIGIKENGLLHVSEMSDKFIQSPHEVIKLNQHLKLKVKDIDAERKRISLSLKS